MTMIESMAKASHDFFRTKYTLLPPWDELPDEPKTMALDHMRAILGAVENKWAESLNVDTGSISWTDDQVWSHFVAAILAETP